MLHKTLHFILSKKILVTVFITGASVLVIEVAAVRILSPFFGNTLYSFSSILSTVLLALSLGYFYGGRMADENPTQKKFYGIIIYAGIAVLVLHLLSLLALPLLGYGLSLKWGPLISSLVLFFVPSFLLGMLSPYAIKLQSIGSDMSTIGKISGEVFFWSTLGSIGGSLISGFFLIPHYGTDTIVLSLSMFLIILGVFGLGRGNISRKTAEVVGLFLIITLVTSVLWQRGVESNFIVWKDGLYSKISIYDGTHIGKPTRFFFQDASAAGAMNISDGGLAYEYMKYYDVHRIFKKELNRALVIGGGIYLIPKVMLQDNHEVVVDVAEIEPELYDLAKIYFGLEDSDRLKNYIMDGRRLLFDSSPIYDFIFVDAYRSLYSVPVHMTTKEFFELAKSRLTDGGVFMANIIGSLSSDVPSFTLSEIKTFKSVFPNSYFIATVDPKSTVPQNFIFIGINNSEVIDLESNVILSDENSIVRNLGKKLININNLDLEQHIIFTDRFAPVEYYSSNFYKQTSTLLR